MKKINIVLFCGSKMISFSSSAEDMANDEAMLYFHFPALEVPVIQNVLRFNSGKLKPGDHLHMGGKYSLYCVEIDM